MPRLSKSDKEILAQMINEMGVNAAMEAWRRSKGWRPSLGELAQYLRFSEGTSKGVKKKALAQKRRRRGRYGTLLGIGAGAGYFVGRKEKEQKEVQYGWKKAVGTEVAVAGALTGVGAAWEKWRNRKKKPKTKSNLRIKNSST